MMKVRSSYKKTNFLISYFRNYYRVDCPRGIFSERNSENTAQNSIFLFPFKRWDQRGEFRVTSRTIFSSWIFPNMVTDLTCTQFLVASVDNSIELYQQGDKNYEKLSSLESPGHRADIRSLALSSADEMLLSTSRGTHHLPNIVMSSSDGTHTNFFTTDLVKVWNVNTRTCIRTIESGYGICGLFVPGDRHVVIGTKTGKIEIYDLQSARCLEVVDAHAGPVWSLTLKYVASLLGTYDLDLTEISQARSNGVPFG